MVLSLNLWNGIIWPSLSKTIAFVFPIYGAFPERFVIITFPITELISYSQAEEIPFSSFRECVIHNVNFSSENLRVEHRSGHGAVNALQSYASSSFCTV